MKHMINSNMYDYMFYLSLLPTAGYILWHLVGESRQAALNSGSLLPPVRLWWVVWEWYPLYADNRMMRTC